LFYRGISRLVRVQAKICQTTQRCNRNTGLHNNNIKPDAEIDVEKPHYDGQQPQEEEEIAVATDTETGAQPSVPGLFKPP
jgi:hypothetical protein